MQTGVNGKILLLTLIALLWCGTFCAAENNEETYIVTFKPVGGFRPQRAGELLDEFNSGHPKGVITHHFRTKVRGNKLVGYICVDTEAGKEAVAEMLDESSQLALLNVRLATEDDLEKHYAMRQESLSRGGGKNNSSRKKKAENQRSSKSVECDKDVCRIVSDDLRKSSSHDKLDFCLPDTFGRVVDSHDYDDVPVLVMSGACWCGGCQQDAEPLRRIAEKYSARGLQTIRTVAGDNELAALDFQKHYRLGFVQLLDTNRSFEKRYNRDGWTFLMLADREGKIVYKVNGPGEEDWNNLMKKIDDVLAEPMTNSSVKRDGVAYMPHTLERSGETGNSRVDERFSSLACGEDDKVYVVFTSNRNGNSDVFVRFYDGTEWSEDIAIAATDADEYDGTVLVDKKGVVWVTWTSNSDGKNYNVFVTSLTNPTEVGSSEQLTDWDDDAMHARMACDDKGRVWVTYYKWHRLWGKSRDKEVYVRRFEEGKWCDEMQVSPTDVPEYEDHSDPAIVSYGDDAVVVWSWDFHPPVKGYSRQGEAPTIFMRSVSSNMELGKVSAISGKNIDVTPVVAVNGGSEIWCAWDSLGRGQQKSVCVGRGRIGRDARSSNVVDVSGSVSNICSPSFAVRGTGGMTLLWSERQDGNKWVLKKADLDGKDDWSVPEIVVSQENPRYCSAGYDDEGELWISYSAETDEGRAIVVTRAERNEKAGGETRGNQKDAEVGSLSVNSEAVDELRRAIDEKYSYRDLRGVDWGKLFDEYGPLLGRAKTAEKFAEIAAKMLRRAKDMHVWVKVGGETIGGYKRKIRRNYNIDTLRETVPEWRDRNEIVSTGRFSDGIGYIMIKSWRRGNPNAIGAALKGLDEFSDLPGLVIDVRPNGGGAEPLAQEFAGRFVENPVIYAKHVYRDADARGGFGRVHERVLEPDRTGEKYRGKIAVLMGKANMSSCEAFLLMMKQVPNCKLIGGKSYGSSGNPKAVGLGNGVSVWLPSWKALRPDGSCFEGEGIRPDVVVRTTASQLSKRDRVLEAALEYLRE